MIALAAGLLLALASAGLLGGGCVAAWADIADQAGLSKEPAWLPWLAGELLAAGVFLAVPAVLLIVVSVRKPRGRHSSNQSGSTA